MKRPVHSINACFVGVLTLLIGACVTIDGNDDGASGGTSNPEDDGGDGDTPSDDDTGDDAPGDDAPGDTPSDQDVENCQMTCDNVLFFDCITIQTHQECYATCPERTSSDIDLFEACAMNTLPECNGCYDAFVDASPATAGDSGSNAGGGDGGDDSGSAPSCLEACFDWLQASCEAFDGFESCGDFCGSIPADLHGVVVECVDNREGCTLPRECEFEGETQGG